MKNYRLYDMYDYTGVVVSKNNRIAECGTLDEARKAAAAYDRDCDGECCIFICPFNEEAGKFLAIDAELFDYDVEVDY